MPASLRPLALLVVGALATACTARESVAPDAQAGAGVPRRATLIFTADVWGQLEPCGCSADMRGGLDRAAAWVKARRAEGPTLLVDAGDAFFAETRYDEREAAQARRKAEAVAQAFAAMGMDAKAWFERDAVLALATEAAAPRLDGPRVLEAGSVRVGLVPVDGTDAAAAERLRAGAEATRAGGADLVVALVHARRQAVLAFAAAAAGAGADFVVGSHVDSIPEGEEARMVEAQIPVFFTQGRGQSLLQIEVVIRGPGKLRLAGNPAERAQEIETLGERIRTFKRRLAALPEGADPAPFRAKVEELRARRKALAEAAVAPPAEGSYLAWRFVPVTQDLPADPAVRAVLAAYDRDVAAANLARAKADPRSCPDPAPGEARYVGGAACAACHQAAHAFWRGTRHAHAFETLVAANKQYDLDCVRCHVTGWEAPGGACDVGQVEGREDVTCESCHGAGSLHVAAPTEAKLPAQVPERTCLRCHTPENSTAFDYATYRARVIGPGHGAKAE